MKVVAFNGSPRRGGNTESMLQTVLEELARHGIQTELIQVGGTGLRTCVACNYCQQHRTSECAFTGDPINEWIGKAKAADGIILGSPVYFYNVTGEMKALMDRMGYVARGNGRMFTGKAGAAVVAMRRSGAITALDAMLNFFMAMQMYIVGGPSFVVARDMGDASQDAEGLQNLHALGRNMAQLLDMMNQYRQGKA